MSNTTVTPMTFWTSIPKPLRFAAWVWGVLTIAWVVAGVIAGVIWMVVLAAALD